MNDGLEESLREIAKSLQSIDTRLGLLLLNTEASKWPRNGKRSAFEELLDLTKSEEAYFGSSKRVERYLKEFGNLRFGGINDPSIVIEAFWRDIDKSHLEYTFGDLSRQLYLRHDYPEGNRNRNDKIKKAVLEAVESGDIKKDKSIKAYLGAENFTKANKVLLDLTTMEKILPFLKKPLGKDF